MVIGGGNVHSKELDRFSRSFEAQAGVGQHHDAESNQDGCNNGFGIHNSFVIRFPVDVSEPRLG